MKPYISAVAALALIAGAASATAETQAPDAKQAVAGGRWLFLQGTGKYGSGEHHWYYVTPGDHNFRLPHRG